jgi:tetratricopeptide (TPR) repeat protein
MHPVSRRILVLFIFAAALTAGCGRKEITSLQRKEAANIASEAQFALTLRDFARAEPLLAKAVELCPDSSQYWQSLGMVRVRLDNRAGAKDAYGQMLDQARDQYKRDATQTDALLQQVYALALLGRADEAREVLAKAQKNHPEDQTLGSFVQSGQLDRILSDPSFKEIAL